MSTRNETSLGWEVAGAELASIGKGCCEKYEESKAATRGWKLHYRVNWIAMSGDEKNADDRKMRRDGDRCVRIFKQIGYANGELNGKQLRFAEEG